MKMRDATKKQLDLQEVLFSKMVVRSEPALNKHLQHAVQVTHRLSDIQQGLGYMYTVRGDCSLHPSIDPSPPPTPLPKI